MRYALQTLWYERGRYFPGIVAVAFSALLVGLQVGLLLGLFSSVSLVVDHTTADVWVGSYGVTSVDQGQAIPEIHITRLAGLPGVQHCEIFLQGRGLWIKPDGTTELCMVIGSRLGPDALGAVPQLTPELRSLLSEPGTVVIDESDRGRLGVSGIGDIGNISDRRVRVVGMVRGLRGLANSYVFCSVQTARNLLYLKPDETMYLLARCQSPEASHAVVEHFRNDHQMSAHTREQFSLQSRMYWLTKTKAGLALGWMAVLGLVVGAVVTGQTLYTATAASLREYAVLRAMGIPRWRMMGAVAWQCLGVGLLGAGIALPAVFGLAGLADLLGVRVLLPAWLLGGMLVVTLAVALLSGLAALRLLRSVEPALLLR